MGIENNSTLNKAWLKLETSASEAATCSGRCSCWGATCFGGQWHHSTSSCQLKWTCHTQSWALKPTSHAESYVWCQKSNSHKFQKKNMNRKNIPPQQLTWWFLLAPDFADTLMKEKHTKLHPNHQAQYSCSSASSSANSHRSHIFQKGRSTTNQKNRLFY